MWATSRNKGFTIVELLIVIVIIGILAAITIVAYNGITGRANVSAAQSAASQAAKKVTAHATLNSETLPTTLAQAGINDSNGTTYQYTANTAATPNNYCITATTSGTSVHIAGTVSGVFKPVEGPCPGHTGTAPTVAASGDCPSGYIVVPGSSLYGTDAFCVMKYEAKIQGQGNGNQTYNASLVAEARAGGTPWVSISQTNAIAEAAAACSGCHLITEAEWLTIAQNVLNVDSNWSGGSVGSGAIHSGHNDNSPSGNLAGTATPSNECYGTINYDQQAPSCSDASAQHRALTLSNGEVIWDFAGNVWEWTDGKTEGGNQPGASGGSWRQWNALPVSGNLSPNPFPSYANPNAAGWTSTQGIGQVHSSSTELNLRAFRRGGYWIANTQSGVFALVINSAPGSTSADTGFRVAR